jgi:RNA polymerase sigma-70 factor (ECF subfamily)
MSGPFHEGAIDAELLGRLLAEHGPALALYAAQWTDAADDCVQEALVELAQQPARPERVVAWLYRVVKHRALNAARAARRRREREARSMGQRFAVSRQLDAMDRSDAIALIDALDQLESSEREVVVMRVWGNLTYDEIAVALSVSIASAHRQYHRALQKLRQILESPCSTKANPESLN